MNTHNVWGRLVLRPESDLDRQLIRRVVLDQLDAAELAEQLSPFYDGPEPRYEVNGWRADSPAADDGTVEVRVDWFARSPEGEDRSSRLTAAVLIADEGGSLIAGVVAAGRWRPWPDHWKWVVEQYRSEPTAADEGGAP